MGGFRGRVAALLLLTPLLGAVPVPDLDVVVPAGTPVEWIGQIATVRVAEDRTRVPTAEKGQTVLKVPTPRMPRYDVANIYGYIKIITKDLPTELKWAVRMTGRGARGTIRTEDGSPVGFKFPPDLPGDVYWLAMGALCRHLLHPALVSESEVIEYLIYLGEAASVACAAAMEEPALGRICRDVLREVNNGPTGIIRLNRGETRKEKMLRRLVTEDLVRTYPFALNRQFASRLRLLGEEILPYVIEASRSDNRFLRRNAVHFLGSFRAGPALERLREVVADPPDGVCLNRAVEGLVAQHDTAGGGAVLKRLRKAKKSKVPFLIQALGRLRYKGAIGAIVSEMKRARKDFDVQLAGTVALGRIGHEASTVKSSIRRFEQTKFSDPEPSRRPVYRDPEGTRIRIAEQVGRAARASIGEKSAIRSIPQLLDPGPGAGSDNLRDRFRQGQRGVRRTLPPAVFIVMETLAASKRGREKLMEVAMDEREESMMRAHALFNATRVSADRKALGRLADLSQPQPVAELALRILVNSDPATAIDSARRIVGEYRWGGGDAQAHVVAVALEVLGRYKANDRLKLISILEAELKRGRRGGSRSVWGQGLPMQGVLSSPPAIVERVAIEIGRFGGKKRTSRQALQRLLEAKGAAGRAEACIALAGVGSIKAYRLLIGALSDTDPWVRFMAYRALRTSSGKDLFCDWLYGPASAREEPIRGYAQWLEEHIRSIYPKYRK